MPMCWLVSVLSMGADNFPLSATESSASRLSSKVAPSVEPMTDACLTCPAMYPIVLTRTSASAAHTCAERVCEQAAPANNRSA
jgi:hypothetical protein